MGKEVGATDSEDSQRGQSCSARDFKGGVVKFLLAAADASKKSNSLFVPGMKEGILRRKKKAFS